MVLKKLNIVQPKTDKYKCVIKGAYYYAYFRDGVGLVKFFTVEEDINLTPLDKKYHNILDLRKFSTQTLNGNSEIDIAHKVYAGNEEYYVAPTLQF